RAAGARRSRRRSDRIGDARRTVAYPALVTSGRWTSITRIAVAVSAAGLVLAGCGSDDGSSDAAATAAGEATATTAAAGAAATSPPATAEPAGLCDFTPSPQAPARDVQPPENTDPPTTGTVPMTLDTSAGAVGLTL